MYFAKSLVSIIFPVKFLAQFSATVSSFMGINIQWTRMES